MYSGLGILVCLSMMMMMMMKLPGASRPDGYACLSNSPSTPRNNRYFHSPNFYRSLLYFH
ncbi:hypothetical protein BCIN_09g06810 [Botrytis cinerea B05.10]|uniref:Uncharacterized protein n=1 Tax=Botryotinia fuckeliana (strain B05.10) TaxID=332648 RepID=A0A384JTK9_BOTFB|nr:hypothetical protein BCIN_09g06810 [Botrytis cinerea B05.10]ATZ53926.1 hypothetical protein BCIN_09g06810 [Botrytis cinerea B05.10]